MIADFIIEKMSAYIIGGMAAETAAHFTRGELEAIYKGNHYSRDKSGALHITPPPEALGIEAAMKKADSGIAEILNYCNEQTRAEKAKRETELKTEKITETKQPPKPAPPLKTREGTEALAYMTGKGIALIGAYDTGATIAKGEAWASAFTADMKIIDGLRAGTDSRIKGRITRFYFLPDKAGLLCLDIDRKNGKDGIEEFYLWAEQAGKPRHLLPHILQDLPHNFPCYVSTPSGGFHLYFRYAGARLQKRPLSPITPAVEIKHGPPGLTSPGSYKNGLPYILHGELDQAPPLPAFILAAIEPQGQRAAAYIPQGKKEWGKPSWDKIREWTEKDGAGAGRNDRAFNLARHARNHGYTEAEALNAIRQDADINGLPEKEIETAIMSAYSKRITA